MCLSLIAVAKANDEAEEATLNTPKSVNVQAQLETDGSMSVVDQRTFSLDSQKRFVNWEISKTTKMSETVVTGVRLIYSSETEAEVVPLQQGELTNDVKKALDGGDANNANLGDAWFFNSKDNWFYASISPKTLETDVVIEVSYVIHNAFYVYDDVAEVYWDYLPHAKLSPVQQLATSKNTKTDITASVLVP